MAPDATLNTTVQSYRRELEKQRGSGRNARGVLVFFSMAMAMVVVPMVLVKAPVPINAPPLTAARLLLNVAPFLLLGMAWLIMVRMMYRGRRKLQQEIEQLRAFERENLA